MKKTLAFQLMVVMLCLFVQFAKAETVTVLNCDKINIRNDAGQSLGRLGCYTPVTVGETKDDSTYVTVSRAYLELYQDQYEYSEYIDFYSGNISGWVKTHCLSEVNEDMDQVIRKAEEYRWEFWVDGIYHELRANGISKNKCYETHNVPTVNGIPLDVHIRPYDVSKKGSAYSASEGWREAYYHFIVEEQFRSMEHSLNINDKDAYVDNLYYLYDITHDGVPELILDTTINATPYHYPGHVFFTYKAGEGVVFLANGPSRYGGYFYLDDNRYPGLFWSTVTQGVVHDSYLTYDKDTQQIKYENVWNNFDDQPPPHSGSRQLTSDDDLYYTYRNSKRNVLTSFTRQEMPNLDGWNVFLNSYGY